MDTKMLEEIANDTKELIKLLGVSISNPHQSNIVSSIIYKVFETNLSAKLEKEKKKEIIKEPKPVNITASNVEVKSNNVKG